MLVMGFGLWKLWYSYTLHVWNIWIPASYFQKQFNNSNYLLCKILSIKYIVYNYYDLILNC